MIITMDNYFEELRMLHELVVKNEVVVESCEYQVEDISSDDEHNV